MTAEEQSAARRAIARLELPVRPIASRRTRADPRGRVADWRGTMRAALRSGGEVRALVTRARRTRWPNLVVLCDISGSMSDYSRMLCTSCTPPPTPRGRAGRRCMPSPSARG